jgi:small subunit ribosomal protein S27Ae/ubiquitin-like protein Nedd8
MSLKAKIFRYYDANKVIEYNTNTINNVDKILSDTYILLQSTIKEINYYNSKLSLLTTVPNIKGNISQYETDQYNKNVHLKYKLNELIYPNEKLLVKLKDELCKAIASKNEIEKDESVIAILNLEKEIKKYSLFSSIRYNEIDTNKFNIYAKSAEVEFTLEINSSYSIEYVKFLISIQSGIPIHEIRLIYNGSDLNNNKIIHDYNLKENSVVYIVFKVGVTSLL